MKKKQIAITLGVMCFVLTIAISIQLKTISSTTTTVTQSLTENGLRDEVLKWKEKYDNVYEELTDSDKTLNQIRTEATQNDTKASAKQAEINKNNMLLGMTNVQGTGLEITLQDNLTATSENLGIFFDASALIVHDKDLIEVVNALKNAGAEAISINGQRVVTTTAITCAGNIIKINGQKVGSPFVIKAIGNQELLYGSLVMPGGYLELLKDNGVLVEAKKVENITIEKFDGVISFKYLKNKE
ncbi:DUF881 domain-containing protein [uncultured Campylobacter sp.]|uniref:DUF881 domain-containing protein n=1 Tax=uncultured Campylobacter sp. TaxID=218934 RepID=UPI0026208BE3|nr:DUF881 domain-containing protein [uncultured Campylobacter sp.]